MSFGNIHKTIPGILLCLLCIITTGFSGACAKSSPAPAANTTSILQPSVAASNTSLFVPEDPALTVLPGTLVKLKLSREGIKKGETFTAEVLVETRFALRGAQWSLDFDPAVMRCDSGSEGGFFRDWAKANGCLTTLSPSLSIDNKIGTVAEMGVAVIGQTRGGPVGGGAIFIYQFTALEELNSTPRLSRIAVADAAGKMYPVDITGP